LEKLPINELAIKQLPMPHKEVQTEFNI